MQKMFPLLVLFLWCGTEILAWELRVYPEFFRPDPFGAIVHADWANGEPDPLIGLNSPETGLKVARNAYTSFHVAVVDRTGGSFVLTVDSDTPAVEVDLFREWFHRNKADHRYYADALVPVPKGEPTRLPDPDMAINGQIVSAFWVDIWIPGECPPGEVVLSLKLKAGKTARGLILKLDVLPALVSEGDALTADHNSYGLGWVDNYFSSRKQKVIDGGRSFEVSDSFFKAIHETHAMFYEHRGLFHSLGYGHSGTVNKLFAPALVGKGEERRIKDWTTFDRHFGPLLDGTVFAHGRRQARPIKFLYLTINPEWPASYRDFGTALYDTEFTNVVSSMEKHFKAHGWTQTNFEMFFNHKKRYKGFEWDGDETRFPKDNVYFKEYARLLHASVPPDSPVSFVFRHDASWLLRQQIDALAGAVNFWVCGRSSLALYPEATDILKSRGDILWIYGGTPSHFSSTAEVLDMPVDAWMMGADGFVRWLTTAPGTDPWFDSNGASTGIFFSGDRFGLDQPLPSIRLKIQRNSLQDIALLRHLETIFGSDRVRAEVASKAGNASPSDWWNGEAPMKNLPPWEWSNATYRENSKPPIREKNQLDGRWWLAVRRYALKEASKLPGPNASLRSNRPTTKRADLTPFRPQDQPDPRLPKVKLQGTIEEQLSELASICTRVLDGDRCSKVVTERAEKWMYQELPGDPWVGMDNYDVDLNEFRRIKKDLIRISELASIPVDCNLWMRMRNNRAQVNNVIRQVKDWSQWYRFGQMAIDPTPEMERALAGEQVRSSDTENGVITILTPVENSKREIVGFVEICHGTEVVVVTQ